MQGLCVEGETKKMLDGGIDLRYTYTFQDSDDSWNFEFTKGYCP